MQNQVEPIIGEPFRFWVQSSDANPHLVDMTEYKGNGECSCGDFRFKKLMNYRANNYRIVNYGSVNSTRCKHINSVLIHLGSLVVEKYNETKNTPNNVINYNSQS
mgnify:CR=1 FL=1